MVKFWWLGGFLRGESKGRRFFKQEGWKTGSFFMTLFPQGVILRLDRRILWCWGGCFFTAKHTKHTKFFVVLSLLLSSRRRPGSGDVVFDHK